MAKKRKKRRHSKPITPLDSLHREFRRKGGGSRHTTLRVLGGKLDKNGSAFHKEHLQFEDEKDGPRILDVVQTHTCSFGHTIDDKVRVSGICEIGGEVLCSMEGCLQQCISCGAVVCRIHSKTFGEKTYCTKHIWIHYWKLFWRID